ncbi:MAG: hypothetical protein J6B24_11195 [Clostridia bacterium]|nr:hypothetical protein [Clostridia bacterium]
MSLISRIQMEAWWNGQLPVYQKALSEGDLSIIPDLYSVFGSSHGTKSEAHHKKKAAALLCAALDLLTDREIMAFLDRFGYSTRMEWFVDWREQRPTDFLTPDMTPAERFWVLVLATAHPCGFLREKAFSALAREDDPRIIGMALPGLCDHVGQVRRAAETLLITKLKTATPAELWVAVPYAIPVLRSEHANPWATHPASGFAAYIRALGAAECRRELEKVLTVGNIRERRFCLRALECSEDNKALLLERLSREADPNLRREIFARLTEWNAHDDGIPHAVAVMLGDPFPRNRYEGLLWLCLHYPEQAGEAVTAALTDPHAAVRAVAQEWAEKLDANFSAADFYRERLTACADRDASLPALLYGISEVGNTADLEHVTPYLTHDRATVVSAAMTALLRLTPHEDMGSVSATLTEALLDPRAGVVKTAALLLYKLGCPDGVRVTEIMGETASELTRVRCLSVLSRAGKWRRLIAILTALTLGGDHLTRKANAMLGRWILTCNYSFAKPTAVEAAEVGRLVKLCSKSGRIPSEQTKQLLFILPTP